MTSTVICIKRKIMKEKSRVSGLLGRRVVLVWGWAGYGRSIMLYVMLCGTYLVLRSSTELVQLSRLCSASATESSK